MPSRLAESSASESECSLDHFDGSPTPYTRSAPSASTASAATSAESMPPDMPSTTEGMPFLSMKSRRPSDQRPPDLLAVAERLDDRAPGAARTAATGSSESTCRVTVIGPIRPSRPLGHGGRVEVRSTVSRCSTNCGARASSSPSAATTSESPSKTSSSWPPTWLQ